MPRALFNDRLLAHQFHLLDVDFSLSVPPWVLFPSAGFSSITVPEMTISTREIPEGTDPFVHHTLGKASMSSITLSKGVSTFNSDFWRWTMGCLMGNPTSNNNLVQFLADAATFQAPPIPGKRRNLILMHLTGMSVPGLTRAVLDADSVGEQAKASLLLGAGAAVETAQGFVSGATGGIIDLGISSIPGKVFMLFDCLPVRYKPGSDFDASTSEVSIEEIELQCHRMEEFALMA